MSWFLYVALDQQLVSTLTLLEAVNAYYLCIEVITLLLYVIWLSVPVKKKKRKQLER